MLPQGWPPEIGSRPRFAAPLLVAALFGTLPTAARGQGTECFQRFLELRQAGALGYRERTVELPDGESRVDRCEGTFRPEVDDPVLWVAGFYRSFESFDVDSAAPLVLEWSTPDPAVVYVTVHSVKRTEPYRMDTRRGADQSAYRWPTDILRSLGLGADDLAPMAFSFDRVALYLPLRIRQSDGVADAEGYTLTVVPTVRLSDVRVSVARVTSAGDRPTDRSAYLRYNESLGESIYLTRSPIRIHVDAPDAPGTYLVEVTGIRSGGQPLASLPVWFFHPGDASGTNPTR